MLNPNSAPFYPVSAPLSPRVQRAATKSARRREKNQHEKRGQRIGAGSISVQDLKHLTAMRLAQPLSVVVPPPQMISPSRMMPSTLNVIAPDKKNVSQPEEPLTPEPPSPLFMNNTSPSQPEINIGLLMQVNKEEIVECRGTPRSQPFALRKKVAMTYDELESEGSRHQEQKQQQRQRQEPKQHGEQAHKIDKNGRLYKVQVQQEGSRVFTKIVYLDEEEGVKLPIAGLGTGKVRQIHGNYGFIRDYRFPRYDLFFHLSEVEMESRDTIDAGSKVRFLIDEDPWRTSRKAKFKAIDVHLA